MAAQDIDYRYTTDGSSARVLYDPDYYQKAAREAVEREIKTEIKPRPKKKTAPVSKLLVGVLVASLFVMIFNVLWRQSAIETEIVALDTLRDQVTVLEKENEDLNLQLLLCKNISETRTWAQEHGFDYPESSQLISVSLPTVPETEPEQTAEPETAAEETPQLETQSAWVAAIRKLFNW